MIRLAGEIADGVMLWLCCPSYIRDTAIPALQEGLETAGRGYQDAGPARPASAACPAPTSTPASRPSPS
jgi:alkanesulfonate monooxygenase SsuD/methylene tetrahydromethanopterin reductase-like flavin-dependent oxidoreductase (luciferase family)